MDKKKIISLSIIGLIAVALILQKTLKFSDVPSLPKFTGADEITVKSKEGEINLFQKDGKWVVTDKAFPVAENIINGAVGKLGDLKLTDVISKKEFYEKYDLEGDNSVHVLAKKGGKTSIDINIGKKSTAGSKIYLKLAGDKTVYLAEGLSQNDFNKTVDQWREKNIFRLGRNDVTKMHFETEGEKYTLVREEIKEEKKDTAQTTDENNSEKEKKYQWKIEDKNEIIDNNRIDEILGELELFNAASFSSEDIAGKIPKTTAVFSAGAKEVTLFVFDKDKDNKYLAKCSESPYTFLIDSYKADKLMKKQSDIVSKK